MQIQIYKQTVARVPVKKIRALFELVAEKEGRRSWKAQVNLVFISDRNMQRLNKEFRGQNKPTDVLSFNVDAPEKADSIFGEIYISTDTAARQAKHLGHSLVEEYLRLACHGFMHLFGYDHQQDAAAEMMEALELGYLQDLTS